MLFVACVFMFCMRHAQGTDYERLNKNVEILFSKTEKCAYKTNDIMRELEAQSTINEYISQIMEKLESANQAINQTMREIKNDIENLRAKLTTLEATCKCTSTTLSSTTIQTTTTKPTTTETTMQFLSSCDDGWRLFNGHCYLVVNVGKRWDDALAYCKKMDSYLIEITTDEERDFARGVVGSLYVFWTGATDREKEGTFVYQHSKQQVPEKYWRKGEPNDAYGQDCAGMYVSDYYNGELVFYDDRCRVFADFVCEKP